MRIDRVDVIHTAIPLKTSFRTSFGAISAQHSVVTKVYSEGLVAYGEACPFLAPIYSYECVGSVQTVLGNFIIPSVLGKEISGASDFMEKVSFIKGNNHAKAALESAIWGLQAKAEKRPLWQVLGGCNPKVDVGVSIGMQPSTSALLKKIEGYLNEGYRRIKIKVEPGEDLELIKAVRKEFPDITFMVDANSSYKVTDIDFLKKLDDFNLLMIEQPLGEDDIVDHAGLQKEVKTPVCLDESIHTLDDARKAVQLGSCRIINIKYGRVGGLLNSIKIHDLCKKAGVGNWIGGMIETGIGQVIKTALGTLDNFVYAADIETSDRFVVEDVITPDLSQTNGYLDANIEYQVDEEKLNKYTAEISIFKA
ncbi:MAG: o-succinylbenzoate synthase [Firmicutes bacterium]|nr:o-succinylbenzoate synthase [Bacillota bacterium]